MKNATCISQCRRRCVLFLSPGLVQVVCHCYVFLLLLHALINYHLGYEPKKKLSYWLYSITSSPISVHLAYVAWLTLQVYVNVRISRTPIACHIRPEDEFRSVVCRFFILSIWFLSSAFAFRCIYPQHITIYTTYSCSQS